MVKMDDIKGTCDEMKAQTAIQRVSAVHGGHEGQDHPVTEGSNQMSVSARKRQAMESGSEARTAGQTALRSWKQTRIRRTRDLESLSRPVHLFLSVPHQTLENVLRLRNLLRHEVVHGGHSDGVCALGVPLGYDAAVLLVCGDMRTKD